MKSTSEIRILDFVFVFGTLLLVGGFVYFNYFSQGVLFSPGEIPFYTYFASSMHDITIVSNDFESGKSIYVTVESGVPRILEFEQGVYYIKVEENEPFRLEIRREVRLVVKQVDEESFGLFNADDFNIDVGAYEYGEQVADISLPRRGFSEGEIEKVGGSDE